MKYKVKFINHTNLDGGYEYLHLEASNFIQAFYSANNYLVHHIGFFSIISIEEEYGED